MTTTTTGKKERDENAKDDLAANDDDDALDSKIPRSPSAAKETPAGTKRGGSSSSSEEEEDNNSSLGGNDEQNERNNASGSAGASGEEKKSAGEAKGNNTDEKPALSEFEQKLANKKPISTDPKTFDPDTVLKIDEDFSKKAMSLGYELGTIKHSAYALLAMAGPAGMTVANIVSIAKRLDLYNWGTCKTPNNSVTAALSQDPHFQRVAPSTYALKAHVPDDLCTTSIAHKAAHTKKKEEKRGNAPPPPQTTTTSSEGGDFMHTKLHDRSYHHQKAVEQAAGVAQLPGADVHRLRAARALPEGVGEERVHKHEVGAVPVQQRRGREGGVVRNQVRVTDSARRRVVSVFRRDSVIVSSLVRRERARSNRLSPPSRRHLSNGSTGVERYVATIQWPIRPETMMATSRNPRNSGDVMTTISLFPSSPSTKSTEK